MFSAFCSYGDGSSGADPHQMSRLLKDAPSLAYGNAIKAILGQNFQNAEVCDKVRRKLSSQEGLERSYWE